MSAKNVASIVASKGSSFFKAFSAVEFETLRIRHECEKENGLQGEGFSKILIPLRGGGAGCAGCAGCANAHPIFGP